MYLVYNFNAPGNRERLVRFTYDAPSQSLNDSLIILDNITGASSGNHSGSRLLILPDTTLLMSTGDYFNDQIAQDKEALNGKFLRMNLDGSVPDDNPIPGSLVYSWGHRNAQGLARG